MSSNPFCFPQYKFVDSISISDYTVLKRGMSISDFRYKINESDFQTIKIQLLALGLIELKKNIVENKSPIVFIKLSSYGDKKLIELKAVKRKKA